MFSCFNSLSWREHWLKCFSFLRAVFILLITKHCLLVKNRFPYALLLTGFGPCEVLWTLQNVPTSSFTSLKAFNSWCVAQVKLVCSFRGRSQRTIDVYLFSREMLLVRIILTVYQIGSNWIAWQAPRMSTDIEYLLVTGLTESWIKVKISRKSNIIWWSHRSC